MLNELKKELEELADSERAEHDDRFFKTGKGQYGEGRISLGIKTGDQRKLAEKYYQKISLNDIRELLKSGISDYQFVALIMLIHKYRKGGQETEIINLYLENTSYINNWDLVDVSAYNLLGDFLLDKKRAPKGVSQGGTRTSTPSRSERRPRDISKEMSTRGNILYELAKSENLWEKRIAMISTLAFIRQEKFDDTLTIAEILLNDSHDLIHKAVGWMLREVGKRDEKVLEDFLKKHYSDIPRTTLRYAIERFEEGKRKAWLKGEFK